MPHRPRLVALALLAAAAAAPAAVAGWSLLKGPDLRITYMGPSGISPNYVRMHVRNSGSTPSAACYARVTCYGSTTTYGTLWVPPMNPGQVYGIDGWVGQYVAASPGQVSVGKIDYLGTVAETNEWNNTAAYVAPPH